jgi:autotransporter-associated beta strand protein/T5SS/PEP-CTERM-associated repeat protein
MKIGADGNGTFNIEDSAVVTVNNNRDTYVGNQSGGVGIFNIKTGATLNANKIYIGNQSGGSGTMTVSGSGTVANASNRIQIGVNGGGGVKSELHIDSGAVVNDAHSAGTKLWDGGIIEFNGGTLNSNSGFGNDTGSTIRGDGTLNVNTGTFYLNGVVFDGSASETLHIAGKIVNGGTSSATLTKNGAGTLKLSYDNTYSRAVNVNAGTILIEHEDALGESSNNNANTTNHFGQWFYFSFEQCLCYDCL